MSWGIMEGRGEMGGILVSAFNYLVKQEDLFIPTQYIQLFIYFPLSELCGLVRMLAALCVGILNFPT